ncbi:MAG TPA: IPT/TIG domain-containing protein, partial [bacterium]|nr:IPT/TIG domain-containing protein [bacterium]
MAACTDLGDEPGLSPPPSGGEPTIQNLLPKRTVPQDTVRVVGNSFGASQDGSAVVFSSTARDAEATIISWSSSEIRALVPATAIDGP